MPEPEPGQLVGGDEKISAVIKIILHADCTLNLTVLRLILHTGHKKIRHRVLFALSDWIYKIKYFPPEVSS